MWEKGLKELSDEYDSKSLESRNETVILDIYSSIIKTVPVISISLIATIMASFLVNNILFIIPLATFFMLIFVADDVWYRLKKLNISINTRYILMESLKKGIDQRRRKAGWEFVSLQKNIPRPPMGKADIPFPARIEFRDIPEVQKMVPSKAYQDMNDIDNDLINQINSVIKISNEFFVLNEQFYREAGNQIESLSSQSYINKAMQGMPESSLTKSQKLSVLYQKYNYERSGRPKYYYEIMGGAESGFLNLIELDETSDNKFPRLLTFKEIEDIAVKLEEKRKKFVVQWQEMTDKIRYQYEGNDEF